MCSIMCYCADDVGEATFMEAFSRTVSRGPDDTRLIDIGCGLMGFHRLSIMGLTASGMQPFRLGDS